MSSARLGSVLIGVGDFVAAPVSRPERLLTSGGIRTTRLPAGRFGLQRHSQHMSAHQVVDAAFTFARVEGAGDVYLACKLGAQASASWCGGGRTVRTSAPAFGGRDLRDERTVLW